MANKKIPPFPFKIGADPEFNIILGDQRLNAERLINLTFAEENRTTKEGEVGVDGNDSTAELRPTACNKIEDLTNNLSFLIHRIANKLPIMTFTTLSYTAPIGGHIHLDRPKDSKANDAFARMARRILSAYYIPVLLGEDKLSVQVRNNQDYGKISDWHNETPNGKRTYEFRMPAAEWLTTPKLTTSTLAYVATVYNEILNNPDIFKKKEIQDIIYQNDAQGELLAKLAISDFQLLTTAIINKIKKTIRTFEFYPHYEKEIEYILNPKQVLKDKHKNNFDIVQGWGIVKKRRVLKKDLLSQKKADNLYIKSNLECLREFIKTEVNKDRNVSSFEDELIKRIIAFNWQPKKKWCIFGLRKGINKILTFDTNSNIFTSQKDIKTPADKELITKLISKMQRKFKEETNTIYDETTIFIGIPLIDRIKLQFKPFISTIFDIENNKIKSKHISELGKTTSVDNTIEGMAEKVLKEIEPESAEELQDPGRQRNAMRLQEATNNVAEINRNEHQEEVTSNEEFQEIQQEEGNPPQTCAWCDQRGDDCTCVCPNCGEYIRPGGNCTCICPQCNNIMRECHCENCDNCDQHPIICECTNED